MKMLKITRKIEFDAGHRIPDHQHQCRHLHGHRYILEVGVSGEVKDCHGAPDNGMVADFSHIKEILKTHLVKKWDHAFLVWEKDAAVLNFLKTLPEHKTVVFPNVPTVENLVQAAFDILSPIFEAQNLKITSLKLFETPNSWAEINVN